MTVFKSTFIALAALGAFAAAPAMAQSKIGVVDYGRLMEESPQAKTALEAIRTEFAPKQRELTTQQQTLKAKEDKLQKDAATMSTDQRARTEKELRDGYRDLERKRQDRGKGRRPGSPNPGNAGDHRTPRGGRVPGLRETVHHPAARVRQLGHVLGTEGDGSLPGGRGRRIVEAPGTAPHDDDAVTPRERAGQSSIQHVVADEDDRGT